MARESGSLWTTVILSSVALMLAVVVGLTTVPYLARRVAGGRVRDAFDYDVTRVGIVYVVTVLLIGVAALNTGNNLLYVIVAAMLAAILVSGVASAVVLARPGTGCPFARAGFRRPSGVGENRRAESPALAAFVLDQRGSAQERQASAHWQWEPATFGFPPGRPPASQWVRLPDRQFRRVWRTPRPRRNLQRVGVFSLHSRRR